MRTFCAIIFTVSVLFSLGFSSAREGDFSLDPGQLHYWRAADPEIKKSHWSLLYKIKSPSGDIIIPPPAMGYYPFISTLNVPKESVLELTYYPSTGSGRIVPIATINLIPNCNEDYYKGRCEYLLNTESELDWVKEKVMTYTTLGEANHTAINSRRRSKAARMQRGGVWHSEYQRREIIREGYSRTVYYYKNTGLLLIKGNLLVCELRSSADDVEMQTADAEWANGLMAAWCDAILAANE